MPNDDVEPNEPRVPPHDLGAESAVLSLCLNIEDAISKVSQILRPDDFYSRAHHEIYKAAIDVHRKGIRPDVVVIANWLKDHGKITDAGGLAYITEVLNAAPNVYNIASYAKIVRDKSNVRKLIAKCQEVVRTGYSPHGEDSDFLASAGSAIRDVTRIADKSAISSNVEALRSVFLKIERANAAGSDVTGLETGLPCYDRLTTGLHGKQLTILGARPSTGKSLRLLQMANTVAGKGIGVAIFSLEMNKEELLQRQISQRSRVDASSLETGKLTTDEWKRVTREVGDMAKMPVFIDDSSDLTVYQLRERAMGLIDESQNKKSPIGLILVDFLQRVRIPREDSKKNVADAIGDIARGLKEMAKQTGLPVVAAAALKRIPEGRPGRAPTMDDLRLSGDIESEADVVCLLHRPAMYSSSADKALVEIYVPKSRHGRDGMVKARFEPEFLNLTDWTE